ncbi:MAG: hypothetical protein JSU72_14790 [Deltaproteobacteria bacterium]|nr:MAG: hypothetical protein JSU72_14790 [Deltaproteobacteria bacterium]
MAVHRVFQFSSSASLEKLTGRRAHNLEELLEIVKSSPDSSIFFHTFSAFRKMSQVHVPYTTDFAAWISTHLDEAALAEKLMAIDLSEYSTIESLRSRLVEIVEGYRSENPAIFQKTANEPFYLYDVVRLVYLTDKFAYDLSSFRQLVDTVSIDSLYYHFIESRLHTKLETDDFSNWIEENDQHRDLAERIRSLDINIYTLEELRTKIIQLIDDHLENHRNNESKAD